MHINFAFFLVIFFVIKDYAHKEKKTETSESHRQISVAHSQTWLDETLAFANCLDPQAAERASLKRQTVLAQAQRTPWRKPRLHPGVVIGAAGSTSTLRRSADRAT